MEVNPIAGREMRSRWRGLKAFGLLLAYATPLAIAIVAAYNQHAPRAYAQFAQHATHTGRDLFGTLAVVQIIGWMLFAPTLTATSIAGERERGLLESLQLSPLTPGQIVRGKLASAMLFVLLMMVASLPVQAICFFMGGVSSLDFLQVLALSLMTATMCASTGILCSAWTRRGGTALRTTFIVVIVWGIGSAIAWAFSVRGLTGISFLWYYILRVFSLTNPVIAVLSIFDAGRSSASLLPSYSFTPTGSLFDALLTLPPWVFCLAFQGVAILVMLRSSARAVRRPLAEQYWIEARKQPAPAASGAEVSNATARARRTTAAPSLWWEIPLVSRMRFSNPVMMREAHGKFRMRHVPFWVVLFEVGLGLFVLGFYLTALYWAIFEPGSRSGIWWSLAFIGLIVVMIATPMMGAGVFTREREAGTWEGIMLSLLSSFEILAGKIGAILLACLLLSVPVWPLLLLCVHSFSGAQAWNDSQGVSFIQAALCLSVVAATVWCYTAIGMTFSWLCKRTPVAVGWTLGSLFFINVILPILLSMTFRVSDEFLTFFNPVLAMAQLTDMRYSVAANKNIVALSAASIAALTALGSILFVYLHGTMQNRGREPDVKQATKR